jgi:hypothetical protein
MSSTDITKKGHAKSSYTRDQMRELMMCTDSPIYFMENFLKVQHPKLGSIPLKLYPFQHRMVTAFHEQRFVVGLTARQMGKCLAINTNIKLRSPDGAEIEMTIGDFYEWQSFKRWAKTVLELQSDLPGSESE